MKLINRNEQTKAEEPVASLGDQLITSVKNACEGVEVRSTVTDDFRKAVAIAQAAAGRWNEDVSRESSLPGSFHQSAADAAAQIEEFAVIALGEEQRRFTDGDKVKQALATYEGQAPRSGGAVVVNTPAIESPSIRRMLAQKGEAIITMIQAVENARVDLAQARQRHEIAEEQIVLETMKNDATFSHLVKALEGSEAARDGAWQHIGSAIAARAHHLKADVPNWFDIPKVLRRAKARGAAAAA
jgi:hypothetical protein